MGICLNFNHCTIADWRSQLSHVQIGGRHFLAKRLPQAPLFLLFYPRLPLWGVVERSETGRGCCLSIAPLSPLRGTSPARGGSRSLIRCFAPPSPRTGKVSGDLFFVRRASKKERREHRSRRSFIRINNSLPGPRNSSAGGCRPGRPPAPSCPRPGDRSCGTPRP